MCDVRRISSLTASASRTEICRQESNSRGFRSRHNWSKRTGLIVSLYRRLRSDPYAAIRPVFTRAHSAVCPASCTALLAMVQYHFESVCFLGLAGQGSPCPPWTEGHYARSTHRSEANR